MTAGTYRCENRNEIALSFLKVQRSIDRNLALVGKVDAEVPVTVGGGYAISADSVAVADVGTVPGGYRVLDQSVDTGVGVDGHDVLEYRRADRR